MSCSNDAANVARSTMVQFINNILLTLKFDNADLWFDASDINSETNWIWDNGGKPVLPGYTNWAPGEPNNFNYEEACMEYVYGLFGWF